MRFVPQDRIRVSSTSTQMVKFSRSRWLAIGVGLCCRTPASATAGTGSVLKPGAQPPFAARNGSAQTVRGVTWRNTREQGRARAVEWQSDKRQPIGWITWEHVTVWLGDEEPGRLRFGGRDGAQTGNS